MPTVWDYHTVSHLYIFAQAFPWPETPFPTVLACSACRNKIPQTGQFKQQEFIVSQSWRLEVREHGASRFGFF